MKFGLYTLIIENFLNKISDVMFDFGYGNGYVLIPKEHPFYNMTCNDINSIYVHGGLTYSTYFDSKYFLEWIKYREFCGDVTLENYKNFDEFWIIGFDTNHYGDNSQKCSKDYVINETESLLNQCLDDSIEGMYKYKNIYLRKQKLLNINYL